MGLAGPQATARARARMLWAESRGGLSQARGSGEVSIFLHRSHLLLLLQLRARRASLLAWHLPVFLLPAPSPRILFRPSNASFVRASVLPPSLLLHHCCASLPLLPSLLCSPARSTFSVTPALSFRRARVARCDSPPSRASRPCSCPCSCALPRSLPPYLSLTHTSCVSLAFPTHPLLCSVLSCSRASSLRRSLLFGCFSTPNCDTRA